jgi:hypothetical protein
MKKRPVLIDELIIWLRGRFSLTDEEKLWLLVLLVICWAGLLGRTLSTRSQSSEPLSATEIKQRVTPSE